MDDTNKNTDTNLPDMPPSLDSDQANSGSTSNDNASSEARENLKAVLQVGLTVQMISVVIAYAMKTGKEEFLRKLNDLLLEFNSTLTDDEKKGLQEDTNRMVDQKAEELVESLGETLSPEELEEAINEMKSIANV